MRHGRRARAFGRGYSGKAGRGSIAWLLVSISLAAGTAGAQAQDLESRAAAARDADDVTTALGLYRQAVQEKPGWLEGWWFLGLLNYQSQRFADARQAFAEFTKLNPAGAAGWAFLGLCEYETGDYNGALPHLERGLAGGGRLEPEVAQVARFHRALLLTRAGKFDRARGELEPFVARGIHDRVLTAGLGLNALDIPALPQETPAAQRELIEMAGKTAYAWIKGDTSETEAAFRALLSAYPSAPGVHYLYATYLLAPRSVAVNGELQRELEVNPGNSRARATLALRLAEAGAAAAALPLARKAVADSPGLALAQDAYGVVLLKTGAFSEAIEHLQEAVRIAPENLGYHTALATAYSEAGRYGEARSERQASIKLAEESRGPG